jgi:hypothetical protein
MSQKKNYCPTCTDICDSHPKICTICGDALVAQPQEQRNVPATNNREVSFQQPTINSFGGGGDWETPTEEAMDPQQAGTKNYPTSKECLQKIPRITIDPHSAILYEATVEVEVETGENDEDASSGCRMKKNYTFDATIGEFEPHPPFDISGYLELSRPVHGSLSLTCSNIITDDAGVGEISKKILYMERGGNMTFVQKAQNAKSIGAKAVICGNNVPIWPYVMKDSGNQARKDDVPIFMLKRSDGQIVKRILQVQMNSKSSVAVKVKIEAKRKCNSCIICTEGFHTGNVVMRLPLCGHVFHEECALSWLTKHNTCPYCRRELPAENEKYESERRRTGRSHAGTSDADGSLAEDQWEMIFG